MKLILRLIYARARYGNIIERYNKHGTRIKYSELKQELLIIERDAQYEKLKATVD